MPDPAVMIALPGLLRAALRTVEKNAPIYAPTMALHCALLALLEAAVFTADQYAALTPLPAPARHAGPQQIHAAVGAGRDAGPEHLTAHVPVPGSLGGWPPAQVLPESDVEPLVPRRAAGLPHGRPHP